MANIDKAAIAFSIAIVAVGVGFAAYAGYAQDNAPYVSAPVVAKTAPTTTAPSTQFGADIAAKVKANPSEVETLAQEEQAAKQEKEIMKEEEKSFEEEITGVDAAKEKSAELKEEVKMETKPSEPKTVSVTIPAGTSSPGCETTNECYTPASVTINVGDTVEWDNVDTAAHTVTGGSPADGPSGVFDSSLVMGKAKYSHTFDNAGSYDYFCMVHPWMVGKVIVN